MITTRYAVVNSEGETIRTVVASTLESASKKIKHLYPNGWPFVRLVVDVSTDTIKSGTTFKTARAAIAKATGEEE